MKIDIFESAFRKIKEATGVSDVNEVIQKIVSQEGTIENLMLLTKDNQAKIRALTNAKEAARQRVDEVKYAGGGGGHRRKLVDDLEEQCHTSAAKLDRSRAKVERLNGVLISVKAGVKHLQEKVAPAMQELVRCHLRECSSICSNARRCIREIEREIDFNVQMQ